MTQWYMRVYAYGILMCLCKTVYIIMNKNTSCVQNVCVYLVYPHSAILLFVSPYQVHYIEHVHDYCCVNNIAQN